LIIEEKENLTNYLYSTVCCFS